MEKGVPMKINYVLRIPFYIPCCTSPFVHRSIVSIVWRQVKTIHFVILMLFEMCFDSLVEIE